MNKEGFNIINTLIYKNKLKFIREAKNCLKGESFKSLHDVINNKKIEMGKCLSLLDKFDKVNILETRELIKSFIYMGEVDFILENIGALRGINVMDIFYFLIKMNDYKSIVRNIYNYPSYFPSYYIENNDLMLHLINIDPNFNYLKDYASHFELSRSTILKISQKCSFDGLSDFINELKVLSPEDEAKYENDIYYFDLLLNNSDIDFSFDKLQYYSKKQAAIKLINNDCGMIIVRSVNKGEFQNLDSNHVLDILFYLINLHKTSVVINILSNVDKLPIELKDKKIQEEIVKEMIKVGSGGIVLKNIDIFEKLDKTQIIIQMLKSGYKIESSFSDPVYFFIDGFKLDIEKDLLEKNLEKYKLENLDYYLSINEKGNSLITLKDKVQLIIKYRGSHSNILEKDDTLWEVAFASEHEMSGIMFSLFLLNTILIDLNEIIDQGKIKEIIDLYKIDFFCPIRVDWETYNVSSEDSIIYFKRETIKKLLDSNNFQFLIDNIQYFEGYLDDIMHFSLLFNTYLISFSNIEILEKINNKKINIRDLMARNLIKNDRLDKLAYHLRELGHQYEDLIPESTLKEMDDLRYEIESYDKDGVDYSYKHGDDEEYEDGVEINREEN